MEGRSDDLSEDEDLPQPGTEEPDGSSNGDSGEGPGNVSVDEPTEPALDADTLEGSPGSPGGEEADEDDGGTPDESDDGDDDEGDGSG